MYHCSTFCRQASNCAWGDEMCRQRRYNLSQATNCAVTVPPRQKEQPKPAPKVTKRKAKNKKAKSKAKLAAAEGQITAATTGSENEDESEIEYMDKVEFMDEEEFHEAMGTKRSIRTRTPTLQQHPRKKNRMVRESPNTPY